jgi:hypothetical protein
MERDIKTRVIKLVQRRQEVPPELAIPVIDGEERRRLILNGRNMLN